MKTVLLLTLISFCALSSDAILEDPMISIRCKDLIRERNSKVTIKQRYKSLIERSKRLLKITPDYRDTARGKLGSSKKKLEMSYNESILRIKEMEENIVRSGCPGINL